MNDRSLATSADYADALLVARKAKTLLFMLILLMLLLQIGLFFTARYTELIPTARASASPAPAVMPTTAEASTTTEPAATTAPAVVTAPAAAVARSSGRELLQYLSGVTLFLGTILPILLSLVLLLIVNIMLVGRLIGVTRVTSAFLWCLVLMLLMFPWQIYFGIRTDMSDFRLPGVLYTWNDLRTNANFPAGDLRLAMVKWARFFVMPGVAMVLLLVVQILSNRGLRQALGEVPVEDIKISV